MQKKGILIVSFGTSHASTRQKTIGAVEETIRRIRKRRSFLLIPAG